MSQGVGVFGTPGADDSERLFQLMSRCARLRELASGQGLTLADDPDSLAVLDRHLDAWNTEPPIHPFPEQDIGCYVGTVIVSHARDARWSVWPNGRPVVHLSSGVDLDVFKRVRRRLSGRRRTLTSIYLDAVR